MLPQLTAPGQGLRSRLVRCLLPVVLNTSLNGPGEPMAANETDVLAFFAASDLDALALGDLLVERRRP